jgi:hypothetical protein
MSDLSDGLVTVQRSLFYASANLHKVWLYLPEPQKTKAAELRTSLDELLLDIEEIRNFLNSPQGDEWEGSRDEGEEWKKQ